MSRRVGSPNAAVIAATVAENPRSSTTLIVPTAVVENLARRTERDMAFGNAPSESAVLDALRAVREPRLRTGVVDLGLVKGIGGLKRGKASVRLAALEPTAVT